jgi:hypothetical protein
MRRSARADVGPADSGDSGGDSKSQSWVQQRIADAAAQAASKNVVVPEEDLRGTWHQPAPGRRVGQVFLGLTTIGAVVGFGLLLAWQTFEGLAVLVAFTVASLMSFTALSVSQPTSVTLAGPRLSVRRGREVDEFDLTGPIRRVSAIGRPDRPNWLLHLETIDGKITELGPTQVDPVLMQAAIARYRSPGIPPQRTGS